MRVPPAEGRTSLIRYFPHSMDKMQRPADSERSLALRTLTPQLGELSAAQWKSGVAAWLGWLFDGLDMHLYTLIATPFVAKLLEVSPTDKSVGFYSSWIQAA